MLRAVGVVKRVGSVLALRGVDLDVAAGSVHAVIGPPGSGKTTLLNVLSGYLAPDAGSVWLDDEAVGGLPPEALTARGLARSFPVPAIFAGMSVADHVDLALRRATGGASAGAAAALIDTFGLAGERDAAVESLPPGTRRGLELAIAVADDPRVLLLDEPSAGLAPEDLPVAVDLVARCARGRTVVLVDHDLRLVSAVADRVTVLAAGRVLADGPYGQVRADPRVRQVYLPRPTPGAPTKSD